MNFENEQDKVYWIEKVIHNFRQGSAAPEDVACLRQLMLEDAKARRVYLESNRLTALLELADPVIVESGQADKGRKVFRWWAAGIAAAILVSIGIFSLSQGTPEASPAENQAPLAVLSSSHEAEWDGNVEGSSEFGQGRIGLLSGIAELTFENGAVFVLEGPCEILIVDRDTIELKEGKIWGHCPPAARGFEVLAPGGNRVVDLGTEFGVAVAGSGALDVHVFDGEVEFFQRNQERWELEAGAALQLAPGEDPSAIEADFERFTDVARLQRERWEDHHRSMLNRDDLLLYYDFFSLGLQDTRLPDRSGAGVDGRILDAIGVNGRIPGKSALLFEKAEDAVALDLGDQDLGKGFTLSMWIKPDVMNKSLTTLFNTNGFEEGAIHFQMIQDGSLQAGIKGINAFRSEPNAVYPASWQMVTMVWDLERGNVDLYHNERLLGKYQRLVFEQNAATAPKFGECQIGSWGEPIERAPRNFVGRIDEVMVFSSRFAGQDVARLYRESRP